MPISIGGQTYTDQQVKDFYAGGGNERQFLEQAGVSDPWAARDLTLQARQTAGYTPTMQDNFKQYQQANPGGAFANNYGGWLNDMKNGNPGAFGAMQAGTYTGSPTAATDFAPGGIHSGKTFSYGQSGKGMLGIGDGWGGDTASATNGGSQNLGMGGNSGANYGGSQGGGAAGGTNPYLQGMGQSIIDQMTENYTRNQLPASRSGAMAAGGFGGSRQGVVEANGLQDLNRGIGQNLTNLYGQDWTNAQNRGLQQQSINNSYDLGLRSNDLGFANLDSNNNQFGQTFGLNVLNAQNNWANQGVQNANSMQNAPIDYARYFNGQTSQMAGQGGTQTNTQTNPGNPYIGALGGAQLFNSWLNPTRG
jgi:hypothetical protein